MATITDFNYFDPKQEFTVTYGDLPHWEQAGATYFITFRTADSLPRETILRFRRERDNWIARRTNDSSSRPWNLKLARAPASLQREFNRSFRYRYELELDKCAGECQLARRRNSKIVAQSLLHFDGQRYELGDFIVMPNHVHLLVCFYPEVKVTKQCYSWKHFMATEINRLQGITGQFWQTESFDHLVRDLEQFRNYQRYIRENPTKAGLLEDDFLHYSIG